MNEPDNLHNKIGEGTVIIGEINSDGNIRVDGTVKGSVNSKGKVVIGPSGVVEGEIICRNADVTGTIKGKIVVSELLLLKATARLEGDVVTNQMGIEPGAEFSGTCTMGANIDQMMGDDQSNTVTDNGAGKDEDVEEAELKEDLT